MGPVGDEFKPVGELSLNFLSIHSVRGGQVQVGSVLRHSVDHITDELVDLEERAACLVVEARSDDHQILGRHDEDRLAAASQGGESVGGYAGECAG